MKQWHAHLLQTPALSLPILLLRSLTCSCCHGLWLAGEEYGQLREAPEQDTHALRVVWPPQLPPLEEHLLLLRLPRRAHPQVLDFLCMTLSGCSSLPSKAAAEGDMAGQETQSNLVHQDTAELNNDQMHTDPGTAEDMNEDPLGSELCEDHQTDSAPKDYLFTGGGFCMEDGDEQDTAGDRSGAEMEDGRDVMPAMVSVPCLHLQSIG